jgi:ADP-ribosylglycohydrolase
MEMNASALRVEERVRAGFIGNAAGDAFGLPWEGRAPDEIDLNRVDELPASAHWTSGATSDDTALTLLVAEHLAEHRGVGDPVGFLETLAARADSIPGLGPSTTRAIRQFRTTGRVDVGGSDTNGAPMRALPLGWMHAPSATEQRRSATLELSRTTHGGHGALAAACVIAACASLALEGAAVSELVDVGLDEAAAVAARLGGGAAVVDALRDVRDRRWIPPRGGISLDPAETVGAVLQCCRQAEGDLPAALRLAVRLGGDTDTVAGLVGGLLACRSTPAQVAADLPWLHRASLPPQAQLIALSRQLARMRLGR